MRKLVFVCCFAVASPLAKADNSWPQFRGPLGNGHAANADVPVKFSDTNGITWKTDLAGKAWSSPVVRDGEIWLTTAVEHVPTEQERQKLLADQVEKNQQNARTIAKAVDLKVICVDLKSGAVLRSIELTTIENPAAIHSLNSYASPTPVIDGESIYCHFGTFGTFCVNRESSRITWQRRFPLTHSVGPGSSPLVHGDLLVLIQDGCERQYVVALDKRTGETVWEVDRPELDISDPESKKSFCTPIVVTDSRGREQLICLGAHWIIAYQPSTGDEIWKLRHGNGFSIVPRPVSDGKTVFFSTGYGKPTLVAAGIDGDGDVTETHLRWMAQKGIPAKPSPLLIDDLIYVIDDTGVASCFDKTNGQTVWKKRIGGNYSASPIAVGNHIYFFAQDGTVSVIETGRQYRLVAQSQVDDRIMASPAIVRNSLLLRSEKSLFRID